MADDTGIVDPGVALGSHDLLAHQLGNLMNLTVPDTGVALGSCSACSMQIAASPVFKHTGSPSACCCCSAHSSPRMPFISLQLRGVVLVEICRLVFQLLFLFGYY